ncbi:MAG: UDP-N-acetylglucosamine--N-acetylmuramyl-(pentapeptide) pyrophosphoryl-undecaprenol N-acetylglucosamine transferase, partial [Burkholderiaceae bacterium]
FPAVAVASRLVSMGLPVHWIGTSRGLERKVSASAGLPLTEIDFEGVRGKGLVGWLRLPMRLLMAIWQVSQILRRVRPRLVMVFGGYVSFPVGLVARLMGLPLVVLEQNAVMGAPTVGWHAWPMWWSPVFPTQDMPLETVNAWATRCARIWCAVVNVVRPSPSGPVRSGSWSLVEALEPPLSIKAAPESSPTAAMGEAPLR